MQFIFIFIFHLIRVWLTLFRPGGVKALTWENMALRQQVIVLQRKQKRAPHLTMWDRLIFAYSTGRIPLKRLKKVAIAIKPSMLFKFHKALVSGKYRILFSRKNQSKSGPKGPPEEVIKLILELKQRNPSFGYLRIAIQVNDFFGTKISKECVRRILKKHDFPGPSDDGPSWLVFLGSMKDSLWSLDLFRSESIFLKTHWIMVVMDQFSRRIIGFWVTVGTPDGEKLFVVC